MRIFDIFRLLFICIYDRITYIQIGVIAMPAKPSGEIKTCIVHNTQKNGDIYVLERQTIYDPEKKRNKVLSTKLLSKIPKGSETPVPTRPKKPDFYKEPQSPGEIKASRDHVGMMELIDHLGATSGIDDGIYSNTDIGTAQKIISIARYLLATNGQSLPGILAWQFNHPLPYEDGISEDIYHDLFVRVGRDESLQQSFFASRCASIKERAVLAYDSTTISTYSENQIEARYGFTTTEDGLKTIKLLTLYSIETRQPIAFTKQPGNLPDVITIENALKQLAVLGLGDAEIITDNGYYSEHNLAALFLAHFGFVTLVKTSLKWVKAELDGHQGDFGNVSSVCPFDTGTHGITLTLMRDFVKVRKYASKKNGLQKGDEETFRRRVYLHLYFNPSRKAEEDESFDSDLIELRRNIEAGTKVDDLPKRAQNKAAKYLHIRRWGNSVHVSFNEAACKEAKRYNGYFALASNYEKDTFECLLKYRKRESIESFFESLKQRADGTRVRVWDTDTLRGRMFVQFITLCYYEYLSNEIRNMKKLLGVKNGDPVHDAETNLKLERQLKSWLDNTPIYLVMQWFDAIEGVKVSSKLLAKRWTTEITKRDRMFLEKLGVTLSY
jgi:transposase